MYNEGTGSLQIRTYTASGALPVKNAVVTIRGSGEYNTDVQYSLLTDNDGITPEITLPAPDKRYSTSPGAAEAPYSVFDVTISRDGYYPKKITNVPIFASTKATLPIEMIPLTYLEEGGISPLENLDSIIFENENLE